MTTNVTGNERTRRRYNRIIYGFYAVGILSLLGGVFLGYDLVGSIVYLLGLLGGVLSGAYVKRRTSVTMTDERDERMVERASYLAVKLAAAAGLAVFPVLFVFEAAGMYTFSPLAQGVLYTFSAFFLIFGACCLAVKYVL